MVILKLLGFVHRQSSTIELRTVHFKELLKIRHPQHTEELKLDSKFQF